MKTNAISDLADSADAGFDRNSRSEIEKRVALGQITWAGPLVLVTARTFLLLVLQTVLAGLYAWRHNPAPWHNAAKWWSVYATLVDLGCLLLMALFKGKEGIGFRDLFGSVRLKRGRDLRTGLGYYLLIFPCFIAGSFLSSLAFYGSLGPHIPSGMLHDRALPLWAVVYTLSVWWIIWSPTEEMTYQAYALPRLEALFGNRARHKWRHTDEPGTVSEKLDAAGRTAPALTEESSWIPVAIVGFWWALQHSALPLIPEWRYMVWRFGAFVPGVLVSIVIYKRKRRLAP